MTAPHYLNVPGTQWEQKEIDTRSGKQLRKLYEVPQLLDPSNPADCNPYGEIVVCHEGKGQRGDIEFVGKPTPDMDPLDDEARAISEAESKNWIHPIDSLSASGDYGESLIRRFEQMMTELVRSQGGAVAKKEDSAVADLLLQVQILKEQVAALQRPEEPLPEVEPTADEIAASEKEQRRRA